ncbi:MAG TPA: DUF3137 domain-containing protein [Verrucomicrobiae bacterium]
MSGGGILIFIFIAALVIAAAICGALAAKKRREEMSALAARLGLSFNPGTDRALASRFGFLDKLAQGSNRYAFNALSGEYQREPVLVFDYHYETHSTSSKGHRQTHHHYFSFFILLLPRSFPELTIVREGMFSKLAQAFGYDDIDFESAEFSRTFCVRSKDKRFAYDVCNSQMMEYLLANRDLSVEIERDALALAFGTRLSVTEIERNLNRLLEIRSRLPDYLFNPV